MFNSRPSLRHKILLVCRVEMYTWDSKTLYERKPAYDTYVSSVLNGGCEIWCFDKGKNMEKVHTDFCKLILNVKGNFSNHMIYSELGRVPLHIHLHFKNSIRRHISEC